VIVAADGNGLAAAGAALASGLAAVVPTDTVYGIAVDPTAPGATDRLFKAKRRPRHMPIAVLVADPAQAWALTDGGRPPTAAADLARRHWPGALTLVVRRAPGWAADLGDDGGTVGLRCPDHVWVRSLCRQAGALATTSANMHGQPTPGSAEELDVLFGPYVAVVVDGGPCLGAASTVVDCTTPIARVLRAGRVPVSELGLDR
jgi:L-threonylcarbamoyladenylate synthase